MGHRINSTVPRSGFDAPFATVLREPALPGSVVTRPLGYGSLIVAVVVTATGYGVQQAGGLPIVDVTVEQWLVTALYGIAVLAGTYGLYRLVVAAVVDRTANKRRREEATNVLRLAFGVTALLATLGVVTQQWLGVLFSLGVVGFVVTFALQQPLFSLVGWFYVVTVRPFTVGDRVVIGDAKGDVVSVDLFVTTLWEVNSDLVTSNQPSGRVVTVPNSLVLSSHVYTFGDEGFPYVWNEVSIQVAYETDLSFAVETMTAEADDLLGEQMADLVDEYRTRLAETPVELDVNERPTVNVHQRESWVDLRLRYLVHARRGQRTKNELYRRILAQFNDNPERVKFPVGRNR
jgi:small-conductance mechanosensitive channel